MNSNQYLIDAEAYADWARMAESPELSRHFSRLAMFAVFKAKAARYFEQNRPSRKGS